MTAAALRIDGLSLPTEKEAELAKSSSRMLAACIGEGEAARLKVINGHEEIVVPVSALKLLVDILSQMAQGNGVTLMPIHAELTTQEAADFLGVSRPFVVGLIDKGELEAKRVGTHRRIRFEHLMQYHQRSLSRSKAILDEMAADDQRNGLHD